LWLYDWIVQWYARYALIRCSAFTKRKTRAESLASYTLVTTCLLACELEHLGQLTVLIDALADVVGEDLVRANSGVPDYWAATDERLLTSERLEALVNGMNQLDRAAREIITLHYVEMIDVGAIAKLLRRPPAEVMTKMGEGERVLSERLGGAPGIGAACNVDVRGVLAELAAALDTSFAGPIGGCALGYLAKHQRENRIGLDQHGAN